jgi:hypothetical protein
MTERIEFLKRAAGASCLLLALACSGGEQGDGDEDGGSSGSAGSTAGSGGGSGGSTGGSGGSGGSGKSGSGGGSSGSSTISPLPTATGQPDPNAPPTVLPPLPGLVNVKATATGDSVDITFDPIDDARDYRVYALPSDDDITLGEDGEITIQNGLHRCAGNRQATPSGQDSTEFLPGGAIMTLVDGQNVFGYTRTLEEATLGYGYAVPGEGRIPVYALGNPDPKAENDCYYMRWTETRVKHYVTSTEERDMLLAQGFRDDGIAFYVPAEPGDGTRQIYTSEQDDTNTGFLQARFYFPEAEMSMRPDPTAAFHLNVEGGDGMVPIMRVFYLNQCGAGHDELVAGRARFERARYQGDDLPMYRLRWAGLTGPTTLVVEALDTLCPRLSGILAPISQPATPKPQGGTWPAWVTEEEARAASPSAELFINGQGPIENRPRPFARSFITIEPGPEPDLDWFMGFGPNDTLGTFQDVDCGNPGDCWQAFRSSSELADVEFVRVETERHTWGSMLGEMWVVYSDVGADVNGKFRLTPLTPASVSEDTFLYATMHVNAFTTARRYPQIIISDQQPPVQHNLIHGNSLVIQTFGDWPYTYEVQVCDHRDWDVNNQCPRYDLHHVLDPNDPTQILSHMPNYEVGDRVGMDSSTQFEVYLSTTRLYLFLDSKPYACVALPASGAPGAGSATVTFGDVLYHSGADHLEYFDYPRDMFQYDTQRHYDNLGYKSGVPQPAWDEGRFPCQSHFQ